MCASIAPSQTTPVSTHTLMRVVSEGFDDVTNVDPLTHISKESGRHQVSIESNMAGPEQHLNNGIASRDQALYRY
jgi:hypothetical protein